MGGGRGYPRMGDIEVAALNLYGTESATGPVSSPLIDWGWHVGGPRVFGGQTKGDPEKPSPWPKTASPTAVPFFRRLRVMFFPHVAFPHLITFSIGAVLFVIGLSGHLGPI